VFATKGKTGMVTSIRILNLGMIIASLFAMTELSIAFCTAGKDTEDGDGLLRALAESEPELLVRVYGPRRVVELCSRSIQQHQAANDKKKLGDLHALRGEAFVVIDRWENAESDFAAASRLLPDSAELRRKHGLALLRIGKRDEARQELLRAIQIDPNGPRSYEGLAILSSQEGRLEEADKYFEKALSLAPTNSRIIFNRSFHRFFHGDLTGALADINKTIALTPIVLPKPGQTFYVKSLILAHMGRLDEALQNLDAAAALEPDSFDIQYLEKSP
jgi:tetratricopeptide (TPR) repeat protein